MSYLKRKRFSVAAICMVSLLATPVRADWEDKMYEHLRKDTAIFRTDLEPYLTQLYSNILDQHNMQRLYDFFSVFDSLEKRRVSIEPEYSRALFELDRNKKALSGIDLLPSEKADLLVQQNFYLTNLKSAASDLARLESNATKLSQQWKDRSGEKVIASLSTLFDFKNTFHEPLIAPNGDYNSYTFFVGASYYPDNGQMGYAEAGVEKKEDPVSVGFKIAQTGAMAVLIGSPEPISKVVAAAVFVVLIIADLVYEGGKLTRHENRVNGLIDEQYGVINDIRDKIEAKQATFIRESSERTLSDELDKTTLFSVKIDNFVKEIHEFRLFVEGKVTTFEEDNREAFLAFEEDVGRLADSDGPKLVNEILNQRAREDEILRAFNREAKSYAENEGRALLHRLGNIDQVRDALVKVTQMDAYFAQRYLNGTVFREEKDFFTNDAEFLRKHYPNGEWLSYLLTFTGKAQGQ